jgi:hypothetical protein
MNLQCDISPRSIFIDRQMFAPILLKAFHPDNEKKNLIMGRFRREANLVVQ